MSSPNRRAVFGAVFIILAPLVTGFLIWKAMRMGAATITPDGLEISAGLTSDRLDQQRRDLRVVVSR